MAFYIRAVIGSVACLTLACHILFAHDPHDPFNVVAVSPNFAQDQTVLAATGVLSIKVGAQVLLKSIDGGVNWSPVSGLQNNLGVLAVNFSPSYAQDQTIFVAGSGGLFRTNNQGSSWTALTRQPVQSLALSPNFAVDNTLFLVINQNVIQRSTDRGQTFTSVSTPSPLIAGLNAIAISPAFAVDNTLLLGGVADGLFRSSDGGSTWAALGLTNKNVTALAFSPNFGSDQTVFAATYGGGVLISTNGGSSWAGANVNLSDLNISDLALSPNYSSDSTLWVTTAVGGVFQSINTGASWTGTTSVPRALSSLTSTHYQTIAAGPGAGGNLLFLGMYEGLWTSNNGGVSWQYVDTWPTRSIRHINVSPGYAQDQTVFVSTYGGGNLWTTNGGTSWTFQNNGMQAPYTDASAISPNFVSDGTAFSGNHVGLQRTTNRGSSWTLMAGPTQGAAYARAVALSPKYATDHTVFIGTTSAGGTTGNCTVPGVHPEQGSVPAGLWISTNSGNNWTLSSLTGIGVVAIAMSPAFATDHTAFAAGSNTTLYVTNDGGNTWPALSLPGSPSGVTAVAVSPNFPTDRIVLAGGISGGFFRSSTAGSTWTQSSAMNWIRVMDIQFSPNFAADQTVFVGTVQSGLMKSTDGGRTLNTVTSFPDSFVTAVGISPKFATDHTIFAAGYHGLFKSTDGGNTWFYTAAPARIEESRNSTSLLQEPPTISYQGLWSFSSSTAASTSAYAITSESQDTATISFNGSGIRWMSWTGPNQGNATIQLDGVSEGNVSLTAATDRFQSVWEQHGIVCGPHTFTVTGLPQSGQTVGLDAFDIWVDTCPITSTANPATLGAISATIGSTAGTGTVLLLTTGLWTATSNAPWLHISAGSTNGSGSALIVYTYDANPNAGTQVGTLTIAGLTFIVNQAGNTYLPVNPLATLVSAGLNNPQGLAVDGTGNVFIADTVNNAIKEWNVATQQIITLLSSGLSSPSALALDAQDNIFIADTGNNAIKKLTLSTQQVSILASGLSAPSGVGLDPQGDVYFSDTGNNAIKMWSASNQQVTTVVGSGLSQPTGVAVDDEANVYFSDTGHNAIKELSATNQQVLTVVSSGLNRPIGLAVDGEGNVYIADTGNNALKQWIAGIQQVVTLSALVPGPVATAVDSLNNVYVVGNNSSAVSKLTRAFLALGSSSRSEGAQAGTDTVGALVLPLTTPLAPSSDQPWLTITNATSGFINFAFTANGTFSARVGHISVLGQQITVTQAGISSPSVIKSAGDGQSIPVGLTFATALSVTLLDATGIPMPGVSVTFSVTPGPNGAAASFDSLPVLQMLTDLNGSAAGPGLTANLIGGPFSVTASALTLNATFTLTNLAAGLGTNNITAGSAAGSGSVLLVASAPWTAVSNVPWLQVAPASAGGAAGSALVQFSYDANSGPGAQTGTLTIAGLTFTVNQAGTSYVPLNPVTALVTSGLNAPGAVAVDGQANVYISDTNNNAIREWSPSTQQLLTLATGLNNPRGVGVDSSGNVYFSDSGNNAIKQWNAATQQLTTLVSTGLNNPAGLTVDAQGNVYFADAGNNAIKLWNGVSQQVTTLVSTGLNNPTGIAVDGQDNLYFADTGNNAIKQWNAASQQVVTLVSAGLSNPAGVAVDGQGNVYFSDSGSNSIMLWSAATSQVTTLLASGLNGPGGLAVDSLGNVYVADKNNGAIKELGFAYLALGSVNQIEPATAGSDSFAALVLPAGMPLAPGSDQSWLTITGASGGTINFSFLANTSVSARTAHITVLGQQVAVSQNGDVAVSLVKTAGDAQSTGLGQAFSTQLQVVVTDQNGLPVQGVSVTFTVMPGVTGAAGSFSGSATVTTGPDGVAAAPVLSANNIAGTFTVTATGAGFSVTFTLNNVLYTLLDSSIVVANTAGGAGVFLVAGGPWIAASTAPWLHVTPGSTSGSGSALIQFSFDTNSGAPRTGTLLISGLTFTVTQAGTAYVPVSLVTSVVSSGLNRPSGLAVDANGNFYIADTSNNAVKEWTAATQQVTTLISTGLNTPMAVSVDSHGNIYIADSKNNAIKEWVASSQGVTSLVSSGLSTPLGTAVDSQGNVYFSDANHNAIKMWNPVSNQVTTLLSSGLSFPRGVAVDVLGNMYIADSKHNAVKEWIAATSQVITLVNSGLNNPNDVALDGDGNVYIADTGNNAIKQWNPATQQVTTLISSGLKSPGGVDADVLGTIYVADTYNNAIKKASLVYLALGSGRTEPAQAGTDSITVQVLPASTSVSAASDQPWLTITGISSGLINFSFQANNSVNSRTAHITVLGQQVTITQSGDVSATIIKTAGNSQSIPVGQAFATALQVRVKDAAGNYLQGAPVTFTVVPGAGGATGSFAGTMPVYTNKNGLANAPALTAGSVAGQFTVTATTGTLSTTFTLTVTLQ